MLETLLNDLIPVPIIITISIIFMLLGARKSIINPARAFLKGQTIENEKCQKVRVQASVFYSICTIFLFLGMLTSSSEVDFNVGNLPSFFLLSSICPGLVIFLLSYWLLKRIC